MAGLGETLDGESGLLIGIVKPDSGAEPPSGRPEAEVTIGRIVEAADLETIVSGCRDRQQIAADIRHQAQ